MAQVTVEKYEQLGRVWELWEQWLAKRYDGNGKTGHSHADVIYRSRDHADLLKTAEQIARNAGVDLVRR